MADPVAITSIVATAAVGLAATGTQAWLAIDGRKHERRMAAEARALEVRRERRQFDLALSRWCVDVRRHLRSSDFNLFSEAARLPELDAEVLVHADRDLRAALLRFDAAVQGLHGDAGEALYEVGRQRRHKLEALDAGDFQMAAKAREGEKAALAAAAPGLKPVVDALGEVERALASQGVVE